MKRLNSLLIAVVFACGPGILLSQQQSPKQSGPPQNKQDVPHQEPGTNNPDLGAQRQLTPDTGTGTSTASQRSHSKKKAKRGKKGSSSTQTGTSSH